VERTLTEKLDDMLSVKDFGALGDGITDDSAAIQLATNTAAAASKTLIFPTGNYRILQSLTWPSNTKWSGELGSKIFLDPAMTVGPTVGGIARAVSTQNTTNISLQGITFYSTDVGVTKPITICMENVTYIRVDNCQFSTFGDASYYSQGLVIFGSTDIRIRNSKFHNCSGDGAALSNTCTDFIITDNTFAGNLDWGLALTIGCTRGVVSGNLFTDNVSTATGVDRCTEVTFSNNVMLTNEYGIRVARFADTAEVNQDIVIVGNDIRYSGVCGISLESSSGIGMISVSTNTISGSTNHGIQVSDAECLSIVGNTIYSCTDTGILFVATSAGKVTGRATVVGNKITTVSYGIRQVTTAGTHSKITILGNNLSECSTATVITLNADFINGDRSNSFFSMSKPLDFPSGYYSGTATGGGITPPTQVWGYFPIYVGESLKYLPLYNP
jgi:polygalacturonase